jgi:1-phosphatidylinositol-4-phosphate 5-kinase
MSTYFVTDANADNQDDIPSAILKQFLMFLIASKGYLEYIIWFAVNNVKQVRGKNKSHDVDIDLSPQVNQALRSEILFYTTSGIKQSVKDGAKGRKLRSEMILLKDGSDEKVILYVTTATMNLIVRLIIFFKSKI